MGSVSAEGNVSDVNNRGAGDSNKLGVFEFNDKNVFGDRNGSIKNGKSEQQKGKSKESKSPAYDSILSMIDDFAANGTVVRPSMEVSPGHGFEVGDMVWGKVKSHPWWPGHVYSEEFANSSVCESKREGLLLVAFFGDSSYGWFHPSELIPFDSNFAEKSRQTNSRTFNKAVEEAVDEVSKRSGLGLSCMCRNKQNFRQTDVQGFFAVDVADYDPGAVYSIDAIGKARDSFQAGMALDFVRQLALEPTSSEHVGIDFIKNKATVMSYRKAVYEEFDETYNQAFGHQPVSPSPGSVQESLPGKMPSKVPLSGRQVFADTPGKGKSPTKPKKPKDHAKKDKYIFKRRDESIAIDTGDYVLQKRVSATQKQIGTTVTRDATGAGASMEDIRIVLEFHDPTKAEPPSSSSINEEKRIVPEMEDKKTSSGLVDDNSSSEAKVLTQDDNPSSGPHKMVATQREDSGLKKRKVSKRPVGELGSAKSVLPEKKKKKKKEALMSDCWKDGFSANKPLQSDTTLSSSRTAGAQETTELGNYEGELPRVLGDLHSLALDPFHAVKKGWPVNVRKVFLRFRSHVFQKSLNLSPLADNEENVNTHSSNSPSVENAVRMPPVKPQAGSSGRPDDPTTGGRKRGPSDRQEEIAAIKKKRVGDIRNLTNEKKVIKKIDEPAARDDVKQAVVMPLSKTGPKWASEPAMLMLKFPAGGSLPSINELKARFARYGPMDHSATRIYWNTFTCRVVYRHKVDAQAAYKFVVGSNSLFGNTDVKCLLKKVGEPEPLLKAPKEDSQLPMEDRLSVQLKSCLKKSGSEEAAGNGNRGMARVKFVLGEDESEKKNIASFSSDARMDDINSKNLEKAVVVESSSHSLPLLPLPTCTSINITSSISKFTPPLRAPSCFLNYGGDMAAPLGHLPRNFVHKLQRPMTTPNVDISQQMLSLLTKCNDVVTNVTGLLGYVPYHPL